MIPYQGFVGPSYTAQNPIADCERCVNLYPEVLENPGAKAQSMLLSTPGVVSVVSTDLSPGRAHFAADGREFAVIGFGFYEISSAGALTLRGNVNQDTSPATICSSGDAGGEVFITSGDQGYLFTLATNAFATVIASGCTQGAYLDGYFLALDVTTSTLKCSALLDGATWSGLRVAQRTAGADRWQGLAVVHRDIWLWGSQTTEVWYNAGTFPMPFAPVPGAFLEQGIAASFGWARVDTSPVWLTANTQGQGQVVAANGYGTPQRISTHAVETAIAGYSTISDALADSYQDQGHTFYVLTFPTAGHTWVWDQATGAWHERMTWDPVSGTELAWRPMWFTTAFGTQRTLDRATGAVYTLSSTTYTDVGGLAIRRIRRAPHIANGLGRVFYHALELDLQTGIGLASGQGSDPQVMLRYSNDGGRTFGNERWRTAGAMGQYQTRVRWDALGAARDRVFEIAMSDPVPWRITGAYLELTAGRF